jgi:hypothetical protein
MIQLEWAINIEAEKEAARYTCQKEKGYQPFVSFLSECVMVLDDEFRDGNVHAGDRRWIGCLVEKPGPTRSISEKEYWLITCSRQ